MPAAFFTTMALGGSLHVLSDGISQWIEGNRFKSCRHIVPKSSEYNAEPELIMDCPDKLDEAEPGYATPAGGMDWLEVSSQEEEEWVEFDQSGRRTTALSLVVSGEEAEESGDWDWDRTLRVLLVKLVHFPVHYLHTFVLYGVLPGGGVMKSLAKTVFNQMVFSPVGTVVNTGTYQYMRTRSLPDIVAKLKQDGMKIQLAKWAIHFPSNFVQFMIADSFGSSLFAKQCVHYLVSLCSQVYISFRWAKKLKREPIAIAGPGRPPKPYPEICQRRNLNREVSVGGGLGEKKGRGYPVLNGTANPTTLPVTPIKARPGGKKLRKRRAADTGYQSQTEAEEANLTDPKSRRRPARRSRQEL